MINADSKTLKLAETFTKNTNHHRITISKTVKLAQTFIKNGKNTDTFESLLASFLPAMADVNGKSPSHQHGHHHRDPAPLHHSFCVTLFLPLVEPYSESLLGNNEIS
jgi:hypothetical protein